MAEVLGAVSGAAGLLSLGLQLGDEAIKLKQLYHSVRNAPSILSDLTYDLDTAAFLIQDIGVHYNRAQC